MGAWYTVRISGEYYGLVFGETRMQAELEAEWKFEARNYTGGLIVLKRTNRKTKQSQ